MLAVRCCLHKNNVFNTDTPILINYVDHGDTIYPRPGPDILEDSVAETIFAQNVETYSVYSLARFYLYRDDSDSKGVPNDTSLSALLHTGMVPTFVSNFIKILSKPVSYNKSGKCDTFLQKKVEGTSNTMTH